MGLLSFRRRNPWSGVDYASLVPVRRYDSEDDDHSGQVAVLMPRYSDPILGRLVQPRLSAEKRFIRVPLEERGAFLWRRLDGERTVADLAVAFSESFPDDCDDAVRRVSLYLHSMYDNKFIKYLNLPS